MLIDHMKKTFADRCRKNPAYSLRAFSRSLGMDSSTVSSIMNGKRPLTIKSARKIVRGLDIANPVEAQTLITETFTDGHDDPGAGYTQVPIETAEAIAFWQHHAIMALLEVKDFKSTDRNISERLNIPLGIVWECLDRLEKLGLIARKKLGWELTGKNLATPPEMPSGMIREGHRQYIHKALQSLDNDPLEVRDVSGITMAVSKARLKEAKKMIQDFRRKLSTYMEDGTRDAVYRLNVQLYPLSREKKK
jgi:transcriptional regulator with XRE-family HTH domain